ncbi:MAG: CoA-binding protein [Acidobacteriota bacterium]
MASQASIDEFLAHKTLAIAGVKRDGKGFGNSVLKDLTGKGYEVLPVHPNAEQVAGIPCSPSLAELPMQVGGVVLVVPPEQTEKLVRQAKEAGIQRVWMQPLPPLAVGCAGQAAEKRGLSGQVRSRTALRCVSAPVERGKFGIRNPPTGAAGAAAGDRWRAAPRSRRCVTAPAGRE